MRLRLGLIGLSKDWQNRYRPALRMLQDRFEVRGVYCSVARLADQVAQEFQCEKVRRLPRHAGSRRHRRHHVAGWRLVRNATGSSGV